MYIDIRMCRPLRCSKYSRSDRWLINSKSCSNSSVLRSVRVWQCIYGFCGGNYMCTYISGICSLNVQILAISTLWRIRISASTWLVHRMRSRECAALTENKLFDDSCILIKLCWELFTLSKTAIYVDRVATHASRLFSISDLMNSSLHVEGGFNN